MGRRAAGAAVARGHMDGPELRSRVESDLCWNVGDYTCTEIHPRWQRQKAPLPQLDAGAECRYRKDRLVLPAHRGSLGSRSSVRTTARRYGRDAECARRAMDQSEVEAGRASQSHYWNSW